MVDSEEKSQGRGPMAPTGPTTTALVAAWCGGASAALCLWGTSVARRWRHSAFSAGRPTPSMRRTNAVLRNLGLAGFATAPPGDAGAEVATATRASLAVVVTAATTFALVAVLTILRRRFAAWRAKQERIAQEAAQEAAQKKTAEVEVVKVAETAAVVESAEADAAPLETVGREPQPEAPMIPSAAVEVEGSHAGKPAREPSPCPTTTVSTAASSTAAPSDFVEGASRSQSQSTTPGRSPYANPLAVAHAPESVARTEYSEAEAVTPANEPAGESDAREENPVAADGTSEESPGFDMCSESPRPADLSPTADRSPAVDTQPPTPACPRPRPADSDEDSEDDDAAREVAGTPQGTTPTTSSNAAVSDVWAEMDETSRAALLERASDPAFVATALNEAHAAHQEAVAAQREVDTMKGELEALRADRVADRKAIAALEVRLAAQQEEAARLKDLERIKRRASDNAARGAHIADAIDAKRGAGSPGRGGTSTSSLRQMEGSAEGSPVGRPSVRDLARRFEANSSDRHSQRVSSPRLHTPSTDEVDSPRRAAGGSTVRRMAPLEPRPAPENPDSDPVTVAFVTPCTPFDAASLVMAAGKYGARQVLLPTGALQKESSPTRARVDPYTGAQGPAPMLPMYGPDMAAPEVVTRDGSASLVFYDGVEREARFVDRFERYVDVTQLPDGTVARYASENKSTLHMDASDAAAESDAAARQEVQFVAVYRKAVGDAVPLEDFEHPPNAVYFFARDREMASGRGARDGASSGAPTPRRALDTTSVSASVVSDAAVLADLETMPATVQDTADVLGFCDRHVYPGEDTTYTTPAAVVNVVLLDRSVKNKYGEGSGYVAPSSTSSLRRL